MKTTEILKKAETLDHGQRWRYMINLGRMSINDEEIAEQLLQLASSEIHYERLLALMSAHGSFNKEIIIKLLEDPSAINMKTTVRLAAKYLDSDQLMNRIPALSKGKRAEIMIALLAAGRIDVIECLYTVSRASQQKDMLLFTSEEFIKAHLEIDSIEGFTEKQWRQLARRFPSLAFELMTQILKNHKEEVSWSARQAVNVILCQFHKTAPVRGLSLLNQAIAYIHPRNLLWEQYFPLFPEAVGEWMRKHPKYIAVSFPATTLRKLKTELLCKLVEENRLTNIINVFSKLNLEQRAALHKSVGESFRDTNGILPLLYVKALPKSIREEEALRAFHSRLLEAKPLERVPYLSVFSFRKALTLSDPFLNQPEGELRAGVVSALVQGGRYYPSDLDEILDFCLKREKEQDPVRLAMISALAGLPPARWSTVHLPKLKSIITAALHARDCSFQTMGAAAQLLFKMLAHQIDFVVAELPVLLGRMGQVPYYTYYKADISNADMVKLDSCLLPLMQTWVKRDHSSMVVSMILDFRHRIKSIYKQLNTEGKKQLGFIQLLIDLTQDKRGNVARPALEALIQLDLRKIVAQLIPQLVEQDASWVQLNCVSEYLHRHRQSMLTPFLEPQVYRNNSNRFRSGETPVLIAFDNGFVRWTEKQQQQYADSLKGIIRSNKRNAWELNQCVNRLSVMPSIDITLLANLAKLTVKDTALRDKALGALGKVDAGRGINILLEALADNRAGIAIYALRRSLLEMPEKDALALLSEAPRNKISVLKEIIRLAGELSGEEAFRFLCSFAKDENLHPDVQIALLRAFWKHLDKEEVWRFFHMAAQSAQAPIARSTIRIPQEGLTTTGRKHLCEQLALLLQHENAQVRMEALKRLVYMPLGQVNDTMFEILAKMLEDVDVHMGMLAAEAMLAEYISTNRDKLVEAFVSLKRPKSLEAVINAFEHFNCVEISKLTDCAESLALAIIRKRCFPSQALRLALSILPPLKILTIIESIDKAGLLHPGVAESNLKGWHDAVKGYSREDNIALETQLRMSQCPGIRRLGLDLLIQLSKQDGWIDEYCKNLGHYWEDADLWISEAAGLIEPPLLLINEMT